MTLWFAKHWWVPSLLAGIIVQEILRATSTADGPVRIAFGTIASLYIFGMEPR